MVRLASSMAATRTAAVLELIKTTPDGVTLQEIADNGDYVVQTARNYVARLITDNLVIASDTYRKLPGTGRGAIVFLPASTNLMPMFISANGNKATLWTYLTAVVRSDKPVSPLLAIRRSNRNFANMFHRAKHHDQGTNLDLSRNDLIKLKQEFYEDIAVLELHIKNLRNMLGDTALWSSPKEFRNRLLGDPLSPVNLDEVDAFEQVMSKRLTSTKESH